METDHKFPAEPGTPLFQISPERVNQQRLLLNNSPTTQAENRHVRESSVHEKAAKFDSLAFQGKALERKTNDAALKRAMLGREEAENEMRRYRDEARFLKKQVEEGRDRERKVSERLENVMVGLTDGKTRRLADNLLGKLWSGKGDTCTYTNTVGKRNTEGAERVFQAAIDCCQDTRGVKILKDFLTSSASQCR